MKASKWFQTRLNQLQKDPESIGSIPPGRRPGPGSTNNFFCSSEQALFRRFRKVEGGLHRLKGQRLVDIAELRQVIVNIAANAKDAMAKDGQVRVGLDNVRTSADAQGGAASNHFVRLSIIDDGPGIPAEHLERIFDPYFTTKTDAVGLGLSITHSIITRHGGHMEVRSEPPGGAEFILYLPADAPIHNGRPGKNGQNDARAGSENSANGNEAPRILLMDDEPAVRQISQKMLERQGYTTTLARDGSEALAAYKAAMDKGRPYDAVIMDLTVPGAMGGKEAISELRRMDPDVTAIVSSGYATNPVMAECTAYG
ncbi:MAG: ATP-binding protein, partial [Thermodesulfobacteriota bacterium]